MVAGGVRVPGTALSVVTGHAVRLGLCTATIRAAIDALIGAGYLVRRDGSGIHVSSLPVFAGR